MHAGMDICSAAIIIDKQGQLSINAALCTVPHMDVTTVPSAAVASTMRAAVSIASPRKQFANSIIRE